MFLLRRGGKKKAAAAASLEGHGQHQGRDRSRRMASCTLESASVALAAARRRSILLEGQRATEGILGGGWETPRDPHYDVDPTVDVDMSNKGRGRRHDFTTALILRLDGLQLKMDPDLGGPTAPDWLSSVDFEDIRRSLGLPPMSGSLRHLHSRQRRRAAAAAKNGGTISAKQATAAASAVRGYYKKVPKTKEELATAIRHVESVNADLSGRNNLIRLKNEALLTIITEKRLTIQRMQWEMLDLRDTLDIEMNAHFLDNHCCHGHHHHDGGGAGGGGGCVAGCEDGATPPTGSSRNKKKFRRRK